MLLSPFCLPQNTLWLNLFIACIVRIQIIIIINGWKIERLIWNKKKREKIKWKQFSDETGVNWRIVGVCVFGSIQYLPLLLPFLLYRKMCTDRQMTSDLSLPPFCSFLSPSFCCWPSIHAAVANMCIFCWIFFILSVTVYYRCVYDHSIRAEGLSHKFITITIGKCVTHKLDHGMALHGMARASRIDRTTIFTCKQSVCVCVWFRLRKSMKKPTKLSAKQFRLK